MTRTVLSCRRSSMSASALRIMPVSIHSFTTFFLTLIAREASMPGLRTHGRDAAGLQSLGLWLLRAANARIRAADSGTSAGHAEHRDGCPRVAAAERVGAGQDCGADRPGIGGSACAGFQYSVSSD